MQNITRINNMQKLILLILIIMTNTTFSKSFDITQSEFLNNSANNKFTLPALEYETNALSDYIDEKTVTIHHTKHHNGYINKLNNSLEAHPELFEKSIEELLVNLNTLPADIKASVRNNGGGHANHCLMWQVLSPKETNISPELEQAINSQYNSKEELISQLATAASTYFGSGWAWLVLSPDKKLEILTTANHDSPLTAGYMPLFVIDVWEHAYYLNYQNVRPDYVKNILNHVNWANVSARYQDALNILSVID